MQSDKLPLYEAECINTRKTEPAAKRNTSTVIFVLVIFLLLTILTFLSWHNISNRNCNFFEIEIFLYGPVYIEASFLNTWQTELLGSGW